MSRRADPARIDEARRAAIRNRLIGEGMTDMAAEAWIAAWDARAVEDSPQPGRVIGSAAGSGSRARYGAGSGREAAPLPSWRAGPGGP